MRPRPNVPSPLWEGSMRIPDQTTLSDVQFWGSSDHTMQGSLEGVVYVNPQLIPRWTISGEIMKVYSGSSDTVSFFANMAHEASIDGDKGLVQIIPRGLLVAVKTETTVSLLLVFMELTTGASTTGISTTGISTTGITTTRLQVYAVGVDLDEGLRDLIVLAQVKLESGMGPRYCHLSESSEKIDYFGQMKTKLDDPFERRQLRENSNNGIPVMVNILNARSLRRPVPSPGAGMGAGVPSIPTTPAAAPETPITSSTGDNDAEQRVKSALQRLVLAALRLRGISRDSDEMEYKLLYTQTYKAALFALRHRLNPGELVMRPVTIEQMQEKVDRLLTVFL